MERRVHSALRVSGSRADQALVARNRNDSGDVDRARGQRRATVLLHRRAAVVSGCVFRVLSGLAMSCLSYARTVIWHAVHVSVLGAHQITPSKGEMEHE